MPYRDSKLTYLFKNFFEANDKIKLLLCMNPSILEFDETIVKLIYSLKKFTFSLNNSFIIQKNVLKFSELANQTTVGTSGVAETRATKSAQYDSDVANSILKSPQYGYT